MTYILADSDYPYDAKYPLFECLAQKYFIKFVKSPGSLFGDHYEITFNSFDEFNHFCKEHSPVTLEECAGKLVIYI